MIDDDVQFAGPPRWYCLWSRTLRQIVLNDAETLDGVFCFVGQPIVCYDETDAERCAVMQRLLYPRQIIDVIPLPATPPQVPIPPAPRERLAAIRVEVDLADRHDADDDCVAHVGTVEIRLSRRPTPATEVAALQLAEAIRTHVGRSDNLHAGPIVAVHLGQSRKSNPLTLDLEAS